MANTKKKSNIKITSVKNNKVLNNEVKTTVSNKPQVNSNTKTSNGEVKKNNTGVRRNTKSNLYRNNYKRVNNKSKKNTIKPLVTVDKTIEKVDSNFEVSNTIKQVDINQIRPQEIVDKKTSLSQEEIIRRKERNRRKYENQQRKYRESNDLKLKKKIEIEENVVESVKEDIPFKEEGLVKKSVDKEELKSEKKEKQEQRKEKRKTNRKTSGFTQTINNIKDISVNKINDVREKADDRTIPLGKTFNEKSKRSKRLIKESIVYAILLTIVNIICIVVLDYFNFLRLFDVKALNVVVTILISLIFNFFVAFMVDYFVTNIWLTKRRKMKDGEQNGDNGAIKEEHPKDFKDKEGE